MYSFCPGYLLYGLWQYGEFYIQRFNSALYLIIKNDLLQLPDKESQLENSSDLPSKSIIILSRISITLLEMQYP